jgi:hypothetical protein
MAAIVLALVLVSIQLAIFAQAFADMVAGGPGGLTMWFANIGLAMATIVIAWWGLRRAP